jgi:hypothetical protein
MYTLQYIIFRASGVSIQPGSKWTSDREVAGAAAVSKASVGVPRPRVLRATSTGAGRGGALLRCLVQAGGGGEDAGCPDRRGSSRAGRRPSASPSPSTPPHPPPTPLCAQGSAEGVEGEGEEEQEEEEQEQEEEEGATGSYPYEEAKPPGERLAGDLSIDLSKAGGGGAAGGSSPYEDGKPPGEPSWRPVYRPFKTLNSLADDLRGTHEPPSVRPAPPGLPLAPPPGSP